MWTTVVCCIAQTYCFYWPHEEWITRRESYSQIHEWSLILYHISCFLPAMVLISSCSSITLLNFPSGEPQTVVPPPLRPPFLCDENENKFSSRCRLGSVEGLCLAEKVGDSVCNYVWRAASRRNHAGMALCCSRSTFSSISNSPTVITTVPTVCVFSMAKHCQRRMSTYTWERSGVCVRICESIAANSLCVVLSEGKMNDAWS